MLDRLMCVNCKLFKQGSNEKHVNYFEYDVRVVNPVQINHGNHI